MSRNCPLNSTMKGNGSKPPGIPNYSIEMDLLEHLSDLKETIESMQVGAITLLSEPEIECLEQPAPDYDWHENYPWWQWPCRLAREKLGNCLALNAEYMLTIEQPYPGDHLYDDSNCRPDTRFTVQQYHSTNDYLQIYDNLTKLETLIAKSVLSNPKLCLGNWYAKRQA